MKSKDDFLIAIIFEERGKKSSPK